MYIMNEINAMECEGLAHRDQGVTPIGTLSGATTVVIFLIIKKMALIAAHCKKWGVMLN